MAAIKAIDASATKWAQRAAIAGPAYADGVQNPRTPWATAAAAANGAYVAGVTAAAQAGRFAAGINKAGNTKWQTAAVSKGPTRYAEGVSMAQGAWTAGFQKYQSAISALTLPARAPAGSPQNLQRVQAVTQSLHSLKMGAAK